MLVSTAEDENEAWSVTFTTCGQTVRQKDEKQNRQPRSKQ